MQPSESSSIRHKACRCLNICSNFAPFPLQVDVPGQNVVLKVPKWKKAACWLSFLTFVAHTAFKACRLAQVVLLEEDVPLYHIILHLVVAIGGAIAAFWYYVNFLLHPEVYAAVENMTLRNASFSSENPHNGRTKMNKRATSLHELVANYAPEMCIIAVVTIGLAFLIDPGMKHMLHSAVPEEWKSSYGCSLLLFVLELRFISFFGLVAAPVYQLHIITFDVILQSLQDVARQTETVGRYSNVDAKTQLQSLRRLQLYVQLFNIAGADVIFAWKLTSLTVCIVCGYAAIAHFEEHMVFGIMYYAVFVDATLFYTIIYDRAFQIPGHFHEALRQISLKIQIALLPGIQRRALERQMKSIPRMGIRVGRFHTLERTSTPNFVDFVLRNIVGMLVIYG